VRPVGLALDAREVLARPLGEVIPIVTRAVGLGFVLVWLLAETVEELIALPLGPAALGTAVPTVRYADVVEFLWADPDPDLVAGDAGGSPCRMADRFVRGGAGGRAGRVRFRCGPGIEAGGPHQGKPTAKSWSRQLVVSALCSAAPASSGHLVLTFRLADCAAHGIRPRW
jgi:hypothetical protein